MFNIDAKDLSLQDAAGMQLVKLIKRAGESGGATEPLIVTCTFGENNSVIIDKTFGDIIDAIDNNQKVVFTGDYNGTNVKSDNVTLYKFEDGVTCEITVLTAFVLPFHAKPTYISIVGIGSRESDGMFTQAEDIPVVPAPIMYFGFVESSVTLSVVYDTLESAYDDSKMIIAINEDDGTMWLMSKAPPYSVVNEFVFTFVDYSNGGVLVKTLHIDENNVPSVYINGVKYEP